MVAVAERARHTQKSGRRRQGCRLQKSVLAEWARRARPGRSRIASRAASGQVRERGGVEAREPS